MRASPVNHAQGRVREGAMEEEALVVMGSEPPAQAPAETLGRRHRAPAVPSGSNSSAPCSGAADWPNPGASGSMKQVHMVGARKEAGDPGKSEELEHQDSFSL